MSVEDTPADVEHRHHRYLGKRIPWYVHVLWISFWCFAVYYVLRYVLPSVQLEWLSPP